MVIVFERDLADVKTAGTEEPCKGPSGEVRAVLVVDVPERTLAEHAARVGQLEQNCRLRALSERATYELHELGDRVNVLERMATDEGVCS